MDLNFCVGLNVASVKNSGAVCSHFTCSFPYWPSSFQQFILLQAGEFNWSKQRQGLVLGAFFWGYMLTQIPAGYLASRFGGKQLFGWSLLLCAVATLLMPLAARSSYIFLIILRFIVGLGQGVFRPVMLELWSHWAPPCERSTLISFTFAGRYFRPKT